jgi:hypothetical protein
MEHDLDTLPSTPFTTREAAAWGIRSRQLSRAVSERRLVRLLTGVYVRWDVEVTPFIRAQAAGRVISNHAVLCDRTAAWVWGVDAHDFRELDFAPRLESFVLRGHDPTDRPEVDGGTRDLWPCDWVEIGGVRVTTPVRTAADLGCKLSRRGALAAMDALMRAHGFTTADLQSLLPRYFRRRGVVQLRQLVPLADGRAESSGESWTRLEIIDNLLPAPEPQHWVRVDGVPTFRIDLAYPHARIAVEYDGQEYHTSEEGRARDRRRRTWLESHGWVVIVVDKDSFGPEAAAAWIAELRLQLQRARAWRQSASALAG